MAATKKVRFNIVDFLLVVLVLLSVAALVFRPSVLKRVAQMTSVDTVVVTFAADRVTEEEYSALAEGDLLSVSSGEFGELLSFSAQPYQTLHLIESDVESENPFFREVTEPGYYTVKGQMRLSGTNREDGFYAGGNLPVGVGSIVEVESDSYILTVQIIGIS